MHLDQRIRDVLQICYGDPVVRRDGTVPRTRLSDKLMDAANDIYMEVQDLVHGRAKAATPPRPSWHLSRAFCLPTLSFPRIRIEEFFA